MAHLREFDSNIPEKDEVFEHAPPEEEDVMLNSSVREKVRENLEKYDLNSAREDIYEWNPSRETNCFTKDRIENMTSVEDGYERRELIKSSGNFSAIGLINERSNLQSKFLRREQVYECYSSRRNGLKTSDRKINNHMVILRDDIKGGPDKFFLEQRYESLIERKANILLKMPKEKTIEAESFPSKQLNAPSAPSERSRSTSESFVTDTTIDSIAEMHTFNSENEIFEWEFVIDSSPERKSRSSSMNSNFEWDYSYVELIGYSVRL